MGLAFSATTCCSGIFGRRRRSPAPPAQPPTATLASSTPPLTDTTPEPQLVRVFRHFNANGDGRISASELHASCGYTAKDAEVLVAVLDRDGDGLISLEELGVLFEELDSDTLRAAFAEFDEDGDGVITAKELRRALRRLGIVGEEVTAERCAEMVAAVDRDGDGVISFHAFKAMMATRPAAA